MTALLIGLGVLLPEVTAAQSLVVGLVDFYGVRQVSREALVAALGVRPGDTLPDQSDRLARIAARLTGVAGVVRAQLAPVCCDGERYVLFVGVEEQGAPAPAFARAPTGRVRIADTLRVLSDTFFVRMYDGVKAGNEFRVPSSEFGVPSAGKHEQTGDPDPGLEHRTLHFEL